jgi:phosphate transport system ATP-binding protein
MYSLYPGQRAVGEILFNWQNILEPGVDLNMLRRQGRHGVPEADTRFRCRFMTISRFGVSLYERLSPREMDERVEVGAHQRQRCGAKPRTS